MLPAGIVGGGPAVIVFISQSYCAEQYPLRNNIKAKKDRKAICREAHCLTHGMLLDYVLSGHKLTGSLVVWYSTSLSHHQKETLIRRLISGDAYLPRKGSR
jgi:hypothetical protein